MYIVEIYFVEIYYVYIYECICSSPTRDKANVNQHQVRRDLFVYFFWKHYSCMLSTYTGTSHDIPHLFYAHCIYH